ncbi:hypothetical protein [Pseudomonas sp. UMAB-08]|uniref:DUF4376 domain-containing protein n=1 Tax=Pseudomonas sp. UMAB-08 TaxID=1365375 RepID=UPI001C55B925|nr:hypothetical protein [Pseudomonas sp. UMAB-08]
MITLYLWDEQGLYAGSIEVDELGAMPPRSTPTKPMKLTGSQVARWTGSGWDKLEAVPEPEPTPAPDWPTLIASRRFKAEESGTTWKGYGIATDRSSQNKITQEDIAVNRGLRADGSGWKCLDLSTGVIVFRPTSNAEIQQLSAAVYVHVSSSFKREEELLAAVTDGSITAAMVEEGWPV